MKAIAAIDGFMFRCLYAVMHWIDGLFPFSRKAFANVLLALYVLGDVGDIVTRHRHSAWVLSTILIVFMLLKRSDEPRGREQQSFFIVSRTIFALLFGWYAFDEMLTHLHWQALENAVYVLLTYVTDMGDNDGERRRVLDAIREASERPGYTTA